MSATNIMVILKVKLLCVIVHMPVALFPWKRLFIIFVRHFTLNHKLLWQKQYMPELNQKLHSAYIQHKFQIWMWQHLFAKFCFATSRYLIPFDRQWLWQWLNIFWKHLYKYEGLNVIRFANTESLNYPFKSCCS